MVVHHHDPPNFAVMRLEPIKPTKRKKGQHARHCVSLSQVTHLFKLAYAYSENLLKYETILSPRHRITTPQQPPRLKRAAPFSKLYETREIRYKKPNKSFLPARVERSTA